MFYSATTTESEENHRIRVAVAEHPAGPFVDTGRLLLPDAGFTIDANPFRDPNTGQMFLFFATDYEADEPQGTGLAVVTLADDLRSASSAPKRVIRAQADWQVYQRNRHYKGRIWKTWNCVEGPSCIYHEGRYYCFYSGGAWYGDSYGVGFAVADHPLGPWHDEFAARGPTVLKGIPGKVIGPGHNSCVWGPDGNTLYMVYHAWDPAKTARRMCIDPIRWTEHGPIVDGPSTEPRTLE
jgi:GH43 family beta-xylosidase